MATFNYARSRKTADRLLKRFGYDKGKEQAAFIRRSVASAVAVGDPWNPPAANPAASVTDYSVTAVQLNFSRRDRDGTMIQQDDRRYLVSAEGLEIEPTDDDQFVLDGRAMEIVNVDPLSPAGVAVLYDMQVR